MFLTPRETLSSYDLCIIGAGPIGITIAAELAYSGLKICVLESGAQARTVFADALKSVESEGIPVTPVSRERVVGGSTATWGALSAPLDTIDFESRAWTAGWPLTSAELVPYLERLTQYRYPALSEFEVSPVPDDLGPWENLSIKKFVAMVPPPRYATMRYLFERPNLDLITDATVVQLEHEDRGGQQHVRAALCRSSDNRDVRIVAKRFVLAAGGIENPRVLLNSDLGNEHDQVGRYFMNHPVAYMGLLHLRRSLPRASLFLRASTARRIIYTGLRLSDEYQRAHNLLNSYVGFEVFFGPGFTDRMLRRWYTLHLKILRRLPTVLQDWFILVSPPLKTLRLRWFVDMEPRAENRVTLSANRDALGVPLARVEHTLSNRDKDTIRALFAQLSSDVSRTRAGTVEADVDDILAHITLDGSHHMGGTRMGIEPATSVVNTECRVHTVENLFVAGTSLFPSAGNANPTFTAAALALRLADHLRTAPAQTEPVPASKNKVVIIGGGRRVCEDVIPALEYLEPLYEIVGVCTRSPGVVFGRKRRYDIRPLTTLSSNDLKRATHLYLAVPPHEVSRALSALPVTAYQLELIIDTPAPVSRAIQKELRKFKAVHVAEDNAFVPWINAARSMSPRSVVCDRSVFRYHGIALLKALAGTTQEPASVVSSRKSGDVIEMLVGTVDAKIIEPCDYTRGSIMIDGVQPAFPTLTVRESELVGGVRPDDTIVTKMLELKRLGLVHILSEIAAGKQPYPLARAINDADVDQQQHSVRRMPEIPRVDGITSASPKFRWSR